MKFIFNKASDSNNFSLEKKDRRNIGNCLSIETEKN